MSTGNGWTELLFQHIFGMSVKDAVNASLEGNRPAPAEELDLSVFEDNQVAQILSFAAARKLDYAISASKRKPVTSDKLDDIIVQCVNAGLGSAAVDTYGPERVKQALVRRGVKLPEALFPAPRK
jgi:hypothetical protein